MAEGNVEHSPELKAAVAASFARVDAFAIG